MRLLKRPELSSASLRVHPKATATVYLGSTGLGTDDICCSREPLPPELPKANIRSITMAENAAPGSANNTGADSSRGMPYYERLRRDLRESLNKKRIIDNSLVSTANDALGTSVLTFHGSYN